MNRLLMAAACAAALTAGQASAQIYLGAGVGAADTDSSETSWKLYGGYQFNPTWGIELGYNDLGRYRGSDIETWSVAGTGTVALNDRWSLLGKLGAAANRPQLSGLNSHTGVLVGLGVGYSMTKNVGLRLEYEDYGRLSSGGFGNHSRGSNLGLSLKYMY